MLSRRCPTDTSTDLQVIPSLDPFNDTLDFTSEACVKDEVFGLNGYLDHLIMTMLEGVKQVIGQSPVRLRTPSFKQHQKAAVARLSDKKESPLFFCLQNERRSILPAICAPDMSLVHPGMKIWEHHDPWWMLQPSNFWVWVHKSEFGCTASL